ncbi:MAG: hypothetical protein CSB02_01245 [Bacteroidia bacterium]|nr:MAG: hypothetical protein CSB02_01245 [Bacteroidia bacterium]
MCIEMSSFDFRLITSLPHYQIIELSHCHIIKLPHYRIIALTHCHINNPMFFDTHTHNTSLAVGHGITNFRIGHDTTLPRGYFSAGIHPWDADSINIPSTLQELETLLAHPRCVALGEIGLDKACQVSLHLQTQVFEQQLHLAQQLKVPLIILHVVRTMAEILAIKKQTDINAQWIVHGFNGNADTARQWLSHGFYLSVGAAVLHPQSKLKEALPSIDTSRLLIETDEYTGGIEVIYQAIANVLKIKKEILKDCIYNNISKLIHFV